MNLLVEIEQSMEVSFIKLVMKKNTGSILDFHMIGPKVTELAEKLSLVIELCAKVEDVAFLVHPNSTFSESIMVATSDAYSRLLQILKRDSNKPHN